MFKKIRASGNYFSKFNFHTFILLYGVCAICQTPGAISKYNRCKIIRITDLILNEILGANTRSYIDLTLEITIHIITRRIISDSIRILYRCNTYLSVK